MIGGFTNPILASGTSSSMNVDFISSTQSTETGLTVSFTNLSNPTPTFNFWNFGDGSFSTASNPDKIYTTAGTFSITLNASNNVSGGIITKDDYINVITTEIGVFFATVADPVITNGTSGRIMTSIDGIDWILRNVPAFPNYLAGGCVGDLGYTTNKPGKTGLLVASAGEASGNYWSDNGVDFNFVEHDTPTTENYNNAPGHGSIYSSTLDLFVEPVHIQPSILTSTTGKGFTKSAQSVRCLFNRNTALFSHTHNLFIQGGDFFSIWNTALMTSSDGFTWTQRIINGQIIGLAYSPQLNLYLTGSVNSTRYRSTDGITWVSETRTPVGLFILIWVEQSTPYFLGFFTANNSGRISYNGTSWINFTLPITNIRSVTYSKTLDLLVAVGVGQICTSTNGINWTLRTSPTNLNINSVSYGL